MADRKCSLCPWVGQLRRGWCEKHYQRWKKHGDPLYEHPHPTVCGVEGCGRSLPVPGHARGLCPKHYQRWRTRGTPEPLARCEGCGAPLHAQRFRFCTDKPECRRLAKAYQRAKDPERVKARNAQWRAQNPKRRRAYEIRYKARADRICARSGCDEYAKVKYAYCYKHLLEHSARRYARIRLRIPRRLYERQGGMCPDADYGGCGQPLGNVDGNHVDHVIPEVCGGPDEDWNLQLMHRLCNLHKADHIVPAARALADEYSITLLRPDGERPRKKAGGTGHEVPAG